MLQAAGVGRSAVEAGMRPDLGWVPLPEGNEGPAFRRPLSKGWFMKPHFTVQSLYEEILRRCEVQQYDLGPLYMITKLAASRGDARTVIDAVAAVRTARARAGRVAPMPTRLCADFVAMCVACDAPDVLAGALTRSLELGLLLSHNRVHDALKAWGAALELHKIEQVVSAMEPGGIPPNTKTAYIMIRAAVNAERQASAEAYADSLRVRGVRLHQTTMRLLEAGRHRQREAEAAARIDRRGGGAA
ncbi:hypothetical protein FOA52_006661 [Chlamydomonas sp. UWO 241]|nr:hypothetical protein FOA52_006661 [Chlamydomonas sp. UWO 241]